ncbi:MAG: thymidine phosphorylase [Coriobacteriia bacterium]|nr:thymidine phosphorylase [Coriobacteriia bacterium]
MSGPSFEELIEVKRDGRRHTAGEIDRVVLGYASGEMPDYQMAAWLMAAYLQGLDARETVWLTDAMVRSGDVLDLSAVPGVKVDKHSTGGVADTTTLVLAPLVASCGVPVAKMSGRGLGHTGGTLDKLESIPGFRVELSAEEFQAQVRDIGVAVIAQSPDIDPADMKMYALRDVTGTVPSIPLIVGSIISKKIAGGADAIVLDVKVGTGAFMKTEAEARALASELTRVGRALGREVICLMSDMGQPLGMAIGNALEVIEAIDTLRGEGPAALTELCMVFGAKMLVCGKRAHDESEARVMLAEAIQSGRALETFARWIAAQGGDSRIATDTSLLALSPCVREIRATSAGFVAGFDAEGTGRAAMLLGAGRARKEDVIDAGAGLLLAVRIGDEVASGDLLATAYAASEELLDAGEERFRMSVHIGDEAVVAPSLFHEL